MVKNVLIQCFRIVACSVADPACHLDADPDPEYSFQLKAQKLEKVLKQANFP